MIIFFPDQQGDHGAHHDGEEDRQILKCGIPLCQDLDPACDSGERSQEKADQVFRQCVEEGG